MDDAAQAFLPEVYNLYVEGESARRTTPIGKRTILNENHAMAFFQKGDISLKRWIIGGSFAITKSISSSVV